jgi:hypothetical protein
MVFNVTANRFTQTVNLDYDDSYNITIHKQPWYSTVTVNGKIDVCHNETVWHDNWVSEPYQEQDVFPVYVLILPTSLIVISLIILATKPKN